MQRIKMIFEAIGRDDLNEDSTNLISDGELDSIDILEIINLIEKELKISIPYNFIKPDNFESFEAINNMIRKLENGSI